MANQSERRLSTRETGAVEQISQSFANLDIDLTDKGSASPQNEKVRAVIIDIAKLVANVYDGLVNRFDDGQLKSFQDRVSRLSYRPRGQLMTDLKNWCAKRKELIKVTNSCAEQLDSSFVTATIGRLIGSSVDLLHNVDSIFDKRITGFLTQQAFNVSPALGLFAQGFCYCVPHLAYVGLMSSFGDIMNSKLIMREALKVIKEDIKLFEKIQEWFQETDDLNDEVKKLFPFGTDGNLVAEIEEALSEYDSYTKVFATVFLSRLQKNPSFLKDPESLTKFVSEIFMFSRSDVAEEWYNRVLKSNDLLDMEIRKLEFRRELTDLAKSAPDSEATVEVGGHVVKLKTVPHLVQAAINCISIYFSYQEFMDGAKNKNSDILRELSKSAKTCLDIMKRRLRELETS